MSQQSLPFMNKLPKKEPAHRSLLESTNEPTAKRYKGVTFRESRSIDKSRVWAFCDGSSTGRFGAVVIHGEETTSIANSDAVVMKNVGAELNGMILALQNCPVDSRVTLVFDYLGLGCWMVGAWKINKEEVQIRVDRAKRIIKDRRLKVDYCHHGGHQKDDSDFTRYNTLADSLCS